MTSHLSPLALSAAVVPDALVAVHGELLPLGGGDLLESF
jgi:hypothetical protein